MEPFVHREEEARTLERFLRALEAMADELASRKPEDLSFKVTVREEVPLVGILGNLINQIGTDWETHIREEMIARAHKSRELSEAYEALQKRNDEMQRDLDAARRVQLQLLPQASDHAACPEIDFCGHFESKDKVGGDLYDFFRIGLNGWAFLIADVSGHGIPPALVTMFLKAAFRTRTRRDLDPADICREVNADLCAVVGDLGLYATAFFGMLDLETGKFDYINCGHPPAYVYRRSEGAVTRLEEGGMLLGALEGVELESHSMILRPGDVLLGTTDGIPESRNLLGEMYGEERLARAFLEACGAQGEEARAMELVCALIADLGFFAMDNPSDDDVTAAILRLRALAPRREGH